MTNEKILAALNYSVCVLDPVTATDYKDVADLETAKTLARLHALFIARPYLLAETRKEITRVERAVRSHKKRCTKELQTYFEKARPDATA